MAPKSFRGIQTHTPNEQLAAAQVVAIERLEAQLARIAGHLEQIITKPLPTGEAVLREGLPQVESLPLDLPGREALTEAGFTSVNQLPTLGKDLEKIKGIGRVTAAQILTYLKTR